MSLNIPLTPSVMCRINSSTIKATLALLETSPPVPSHSRLRIDSSSGSIIQQTHPDPPEPPKWPALLGKSQSSTSFKIPKSSSLYKRPRLFIDSATARIISYAEERSSRPLTWPELTNAALHNEPERSDCIGKRPLIDSNTSIDTLEALIIENHIANPYTTGIYEPISDHAPQGWEPIQFEDEVEDEYFFTDDEDYDEDTDDDTDNEDEDSENSDMGYSHYLDDTKLQPVLNLITNRVDDMQAFAPDASKPISEFRSYWREVFAHMHDDLCQSAMSEFLISPPVLKSLEVQILDCAGMSLCPGPLDSANGCIVVKSENGITRGQLLREIAEALYPVDGGWNRKRLVVKKFSWIAFSSLVVKQTEWEPVRILMCCDDVSKPCLR